MPNPTARKQPHPRNVFHNHTPNFCELAKTYPEFQKYLVASSGSCIDWKDPYAQRHLLYVLLSHYYSIKLDIPVSNLIPTVTLRANYIHWIEDLLALQRPPVLKHAYRDSEPISDIGIDIGTGTSCIYPLLGHRIAGWKFIATDIDETSIQHATANVKLNNWEQAITVRQVRKDQLLVGVLKPSERALFCMCNPPFFDPDYEREYNPSTTSTTSVNESITEGGEVAFVTKLIEESLILGNQVRWYTSMLGRKADLKPVLRVLRDKGIQNVRTTKFIQGNSRRWGVAWTFSLFGIAEYLQQRGPSGLKAGQHPRPCFTVIGPGPVVRQAVVDRLRSLFRTAAGVKVDEESEASNPERETRFNLRIWQPFWPQYDAVEPHDAVVNAKKRPHSALGSDSQSRGATPLEAGATAVGATVGGVSCDETRSLCSGSTSERHDATAGAPVRDVSAGGTNSLCSGIASERHDAAIGASCGGISLSSGDASLGVSGVSSDCCPEGVSGACLSGSFVSTGDGSGGGDAMSGGGLGGGDGVSGGGSGGGGVNGSGSGLSGADVALGLTSGAGEGSTLAGVAAAAPALNRRQRRAMRFGGTAHPTLFSCQVAVFVFAREGVCAGDSAPPPCAGGAPASHTEPAARACVHAPPSPSAGGQARSSHSASLYTTVGSLEAGRCEGDGALAGRCEGDGAVAGRCEGDGALAGRCEGDGAVAGRCEGGALAGRCEGDGALACCAVDVRCHGGPSAQLFPRFYEYLRSDVTAALCG